MKKTLSAALSTTLVLGFAGAALAVQGEMPADSSMVLGNKDTQITLSGMLRSRGWMQQDFTKDNANASAYDSTAKLAVAAKVGEDVSGLLELEVGDGSRDWVMWGDGSSAGLNTGGSKGGDENDLSIVQAYINYNPNKAGLKVGHMKLALGNKLFFDHTGSGDDAIVAYMDPSDKTHIGVLTVKFEEGSNATNADDINGYVAVLKQKLGGGHALGVNLTKLVNTGSGLSLFNLGVDYTAKMGDLTLKADIESQFGDVATDVSAGGMAAMIDAKYSMGKSYAGARIVYGSGDDGTDPTGTDNYINFLTDTVYDTIMVSYRYAVPGQASKNTRMANMTLLQVNAGTKVTCPITGKDLALKAAISQMALNEVAAGAEDDLGTEIDIWATWKLSKGLSYKIEFGYLMAGDAWGTDLDDPYFIRNGIQLNF